MEEEFEQIRQECAQLAEGVAEQDPAKIGPAAIKLLERFFINQAKIVHAVEQGSNNLFHISTR